MNRYDRQERILGWKQRKLDKAEVAIIGSGYISYYLGAALAGLGIGKLKLLNGKSNKERFLYIDSKDKPKSLKHILRKMNPLIEINSINWRIIYLCAAELIGKPNIVIDATNDPVSKLNVIDYCRKRKIHALSLVSDSEQARLAYCKSNKLTGDYCFEDFAEKEQGAITSGVIAGLAAEEVRKILMPLKEDKLLEDNIGYNLTSKARFDLNQDVPLDYNSDLKNNHVLMVGAGSLGNFVGLGLSLMNLGRLDIVDNDGVEEVNLNRQILFYDSVGQQKVIALAEKLKQVNPQIQVNCFTDWVDEKFESYFSNNKPNLILDCVDNFATRALLNKWALKYNIPLISGGTGPKSGQVVIYKQEQTPCLDCQLNINELAEKAEQRESCAYAPDPSVIISNQIIGCLMAGEAKSLLAEHAIPKGIIKFTADSPSRLGLMVSKNHCKCYLKYR